jgi:RNA polymerase sigma factor (sigma-70 family)
MSATNPTPGHLTAADVEAHAGWLRRLARSLVDDGAAADDLTQAAWVELAQRRARGGVVRDVRAWLGTVVRRRAGRDAGRGRARRERERRVARGEALPSTDELLSSLEATRLVTESLASLGEPYRSTLLLRFQEDLSPAEIASRQGLPAGTVRARIHRGLNQLRARLDRRTGGRREAWCSALLRLPPSAIPSAWKIGGTLVMGWIKWTTAVVGLTLVGWAGWRALATGPALEPVGAQPEQHHDVALIGAEPLGSEVVNTAGRRAPSGTPKTVDRPPRVLLLLDDRTDEPLPHLTLFRTIDGRADQQLITGVTGRVELPAEWLAEDLTLISNETDEELTLGPSDLALAQPLVRKLRVGPTFPIRFLTPPPADTQLWVGLFGGDRLPDNPPSWDWLRRDNGRYWVRLGPRKADPAWLGTGPWSIMVHDNAGLWRASDVVHGLVGIQPEVLLASETTGVLDIEVTVDGGPLTSHVGVSVYPVVDGRPQEPGRHGGVSRQTGEGRLLFLAPGEYQVWTASAALENEGARVTVLPRRIACLAFDLKGRPELRSLRVVIESETGRLPLWLVQPLLTRPGLAVPKRGRSQDGGDSVTRPVFLFEDLEPGEWTVRLTLADALPDRWRGGLERTAVAGGEDVLFRCLDADAPPMVRARARVVDWQGRPLAGAGVTCYLAGKRRYAPISDDKGLVRLLPIVSSRRIGLLAVAPGYRPTWRENLPLDAEDDEPFELVMHPGWGTMLELRGPGGEPVAGAEVRLDGNLAGTTDGNGRLLLEGETKPERVAIEHPKLELDYGDVDEQGKPSTNATGAWWVVLRAKPIGQTDTLSR